MRICRNLRSIGVALAAASLINFFAMSDVAAQNGQPKSTGGPKGFHKGAGGHHDAGQGASGQGVATKGFAAKKGAKGKGAQRVCADHPVAQKRPYEIKVYRPDCVFAGTTLFADKRDVMWPRLVEVDMTGKVVWQVKLGDILADYRHPKYGIHVMDIKRLQNGNTLFSVNLAGLFEIDRTGKLVWSYTDRDQTLLYVNRLANGNTIYTRVVNKGDDHVREITPDGKVAWSWKGLKEYDRPPYGNIDDEGWIHVNSVTRMPDGNTWISLRNFDLFALVNPAGDVLHEIKFPPAGAPVPPKLAALAKQKGRAMVAGIHDPEVQKDGNVLAAMTLLNVVVESTRDGRATFSKMFAATDKSLESGGDAFLMVRDVNRLPNGNLLITSRKVIVETTRTGDIVWQLNVPEINVRAGAQDSEVLFKSQRIGPDGTAYGN